MSWFSTSELESQILKATSSSIPTGEQDLPLNLEISDSVRSKEANAKEVLRILKKRLYDLNPNVQILTLHLLDLLAKNGGSHFLAELTSKDFIDSYVAELLILVNQQRNPEVVDLMLDYLQTWALASKNKVEARYLHDKYEELKRRRDITFPEVIGLSEISNSFLESATAPDWSDSATCMKSGQPFTFYNRKHHCRNCGGVFMQEYCSKLRPLPHFGINIPVRVCDDCDARLDQKYRKDRNSDQAKEIPSMNSGVKRTISSNNSAMGSKYSHELQQAINLSLQSSKASPKHNTTVNHPSPASGGAGEEEDEELKRAIEASLAEMNGIQNNTAIANTATQHSANGNAPPHDNPQLAQMYPSEQKEALPTADMNAILEFSKSVEHATPHDAVYNPKLISLSQSGTHLQGKVISELRTATNKLATLEDLHGKLLSISRCYDELLEAELNPGYKPKLPTSVTNESTSPKADSFHDPLKEESRVETEHNITDRSQEQRNAGDLIDAKPTVSQSSQPVGQLDTMSTSVPRAKYDEPMSGVGPDSGANFESKVKSENEAKSEHELEPEPEPEAEPEAEAEAEPEPEPILIEL